MNSLRVTFDFGAYCDAHTDDFSNYSDQTINDKWDLCDAVEDYLLGWGVEEAVVDYDTATLKGVDVVVDTLGDLSEVLGVKDGDTIDLADLVGGYVWTD